jgi:ABC-type uncharacterized transport system substrate-binding protein
MKHSLRTDRARRIILAIIATFLKAGASNSPVVGIVYYPGTPVYEEAVKVLVNSLTASSIRVVCVELKSTGPDSQIQVLSAEQPDVLVAFGSRATAAVGRMGGGVPFIPAMVLPDQQFSALMNANKARLAGVVLLDATPAQVLGRLKREFPDRRRVALLYSTEGVQPNKGLIQSLATKQGFSVEFRLCKNSRDLIQASESLRGRVDFIWCLPDARLYQPSAVTQLILASVRERLPIIGFSESFVRAGAAMDSSQTRANWGCRPPTWSGNI